MSYALCSLEEGQLAGNLLFSFQTYFHREGWAKGEMNLDQTGKKPFFPPNPMSDGTQENCSMKLTHEGSTAFPWRFPENPAAASTCAPSRCDPRRSSLLSGLGESGEMGRLTTPQRLCSQLWLRRVRTALSHRKSPSCLPHPYLLARDKPSL